MAPRSVGNRIVSFFQNLVKPTGDTWQGLEASKAFEDGNLRSQSNGDKVRVAFRNLSSVPLVLCWISENGSLHHFYKLAPSATLLETTPVFEGEHVETTCGGHAFCWAHVPEDKFDQVRKDKTLDDISCIVGGYRPKQNCGKDFPLQLVTISNEPTKEEICCAGGLRKRRKVDVLLPSTTLPKKQDWLTRVRIAKLDGTPYDTTKKVYHLQVLGGWPCYVEPNWYGDDKDLEKRLGEDLEEATKRPPSHAVEYLRTNCPIWVNKEMKWGPKVCPVKGRGCCYHPNKEWLKQNGLAEAKHLCVEINNGPGYRRDLALWGRGGVMVHELSHAYHNRMLPGGYDNEDIKACYEAAMKEGLYDCVKVHMFRGTEEAKAYACSNCMEYWAELSTAFLGCKDDSEEYNKWFPFNRAQIKEHDPRAYKLLCRLWKVEDN